MLREVKYSDLTPKQCRILSAMYFKCILDTGEIMDSISKNSTFLIYFKNNKPIAFSNYISIGNYANTYIRKEFTFVNKKYRNRGIAKMLMLYVTEKYQNATIETIAREYLDNTLKTLGFHNNDSRRCKDGYKTYTKKPKESHHTNNYF